MVGETRVTVDRSEVVSDMVVVVEEVVVVPLPAVIVREGEAEVTVGSTMVLDLGSVVLTAVASDVG